MKDANSYYFNIPNSGNFWTSCLKGRKEVLSLIQRHKFKELPLTELEGKKVHSSNLGIAFHIKDLIGLELIETLPSRNGTLIRLKNKD